jgi:hypothetical protein
LKFRGAQLQDALAGFQLKAAARVELDRRRLARSDLRRGPDLF